MQQCLSLQEEIMYQSNEFNILLTSVGRRVSLLGYFRNALVSLGLQGKIVATEISKRATAGHFADIREIVPRVTDPTYIETLKLICQRHRIKLLVPLIDTELTILADHREEFEKAGITVMVSSPEVVRISNDKRKTAEFLHALGIDTPRILDINTTLNDPSAEYPYFLKPVNGSRSIGATLIRNKRELEFFKDYIPDPILQKYIEGDEYTVDVLLDFNGSVKCIVPRLRIETRAGEVAKGMTVNNPVIISAIEKVAKSLPGAIGCITIQCFLTSKNEIKVIEINPRFGGGIPLSIAAGADFPKWLIEMVLGQVEEITPDVWKNEFVMLRYDEAIYITKDQIND